MSNFRKWWNGGLSSDKTIKLTRNQCFAIELRQRRAQETRKHWTNYLHRVWRFNAILLQFSISSFFMQHLRWMCGTNPMREEKNVCHTIVVAVSAVHRRRRCRRRRRRQQRLLLNGNALYLIVCVVSHRSKRMDCWMTLSKHVINAYDIDIHRVQSSSDSEIERKNNELAFRSLFSYTQRFSFTQRRCTGSTICAVLFIVSSTICGKIKNHGLNRLTIIKIS